MPTYKHPGVYVKEVPSGVRAIAGVATSTAAFLGKAERGPVEPTLVTSWLEYVQTFGGYFGEEAYLPFAVAGFFDNGGQRCYIVNVADIRSAIQGLQVLESSDYAEIALIYAPNTFAEPALAAALIKHCESLKSRIVIFDGPKVQADVTTLDPRSQFDSRYAAWYFPWLEVAHPIPNQGGASCLVPPGGFVAGIYARVDAQRGVHKAPANEVVMGATGLAYEINIQQQDQLNPRGVNVIRSFAGKGIRVWGARTLSSDPEWKYVSVQRMAIFLEASIERSTQWVVFEPNDEPLWARVRQAVSAFMTTVWRDGGLFGIKAEEAFFVHIDRSTMTQQDIDEGRMIMVLGFAPLKPAEFVILKFGWKTKDSQ